MEHRRFPRYSINLQVEAKDGKESDLGTISDFSRQGAKVCFEKFDFEPNSSIELKIQRPNKDVFIPAMGQVMWKRIIGGNKCEAGIKLLDFPSEVKIEILECAYREWIRSRLGLA